MRGNLSSDAGLLFIKEFACKLGFENILKSDFITNNSAKIRIHKDDENLWQIVSQILGDYFEDDCADELTNVLVLTAVLGECVLASQPATMSSSSKTVNANRLQVHALTYNIFNRFKRLILSSKMRIQQIDTIHLKLLKIAAKVVHSAKYIIFKLCSNCPYKDEFYETLENINRLHLKLE